jgi:hypothetical protein
MHTGKRFILLQPQNTSQASVPTRFWCTHVGLSGLGSFSPVSEARSLEAVASIIPCLALRGVASAIANSRTLRAKVLFCKPTRCCPSQATLTRPALSEREE